jgi:hypothetical protein
LASAGSDALTVFLDGEVYGRVKLEAGGRISWSDGTGTYDTNLYRDGANTLATDDVLKAVAGIVTLAVAGTPSAELPNGALAVDTTNNIFYFRSNNAWNQVSGGAGGASVTVSDSAPASPSSGDLWFDSTLGVMFIYYDSVWVDVGGGGVVNFVLDTVTAKGDLIVGTADGAADNLAAGANGTYLKANSSTATGLEWASIPAINAAAIISAAGGDGTSGQALTTNGAGTLDFTTIVGTTEASIISAVGADGVAGSVLKTNGSGDLSFGDVALGTNTTGNYVSDLTGGTGVTITHTPGEGSSPTVAIGQAVGTSASVTFSNVTSNLTGNVTGNADTATTLATSRTISLGGDLSGSASFNGGSDITISASIVNSGITPSDTAPASPSAGDLWWDTTVLELFIYSGGAWVQVTDNSAGVQELAELVDVSDTVPSDGQVLRFNNATAEWEPSTLTPAASALDDLTDVTVTSATSGQFLKWNGTAWVNDAIDLGSDTTGNYVASLVAGTGVTLTNGTASEGGTPTVAIGQSVAASATPTFAGLTLNGNITFEGATADDYETIIAITDPTSDRVIIFPDLTGTVVTTGDTGSITSLMIADGTIVNADVNASAAIAHSKLANATAGQVLLGTTTTGVVTATTISGDITIDGAGVASIAANSVALGTDTTGNYVASLVAGTGVTLTNGTASEGGTPTIGIGQAVGTTSNVQFNDVTVDGNLTVNGTTTTLNTETLSIEDNIVVLNSNVTASPTTNAGVEIERGTSANVLVRWNETSDKWEVTNDGTTYGNIVTTADSGTVTSAMITDGTIVDGDISASAAIAHNKLANATPGQILLGTTTSGVLTATALSGDVTVNGAGVTAIGSGKVTSDMIVDGTIVNADINASAAIALSKLASGTSAQVVIANSSGVPTYTTLSGDITISDTGVASIAANSVALGTDTTGNYVSDVTASTGITVTHTPGEGSSATVALNATLDDLSNVSVATPSSGQFLKWNGTAWVADTIVGGASISDTAPASPTAGQIWFQSTNGKTFVYYDSQWIEVGGVGTGARMVSSSSAPASPLEGSMWFDTDTAQTFVYYDSQWIEIGASGVTASVQDSAPADPVSGQIWFNSLTGGTYVYYGTNWIEIGASPFTSFLNTINAKGDLFVGTADNTVTALTAGSANQVLTVDSSTATGLKWATPTVYQAVVANVSDTEIGYLDGVTSAIQTQLNTKSPSASPTFTGSVTGNPAVATTSTGTTGFGYMGLPQNGATTGSYGVVASDAGTHIYSSATRTVTIPANGTIAMPIGSTVVFIAGPGATVTIAITTDTMYLAGLGTTGSRTLAPFGMATAVKITSTSWMISGNGLT